MFYDTSNFVGYLMGKPSLYKKKVVILFKLIAAEKGVYTFPKGISLKVNAIARLESEIANYDFEVQQVSHYTMKTHRK